MSSLPRPPRAHGRAPRVPTSAASTAALAVALAVALAAVTTRHLAAQTPAPSAAADTAAAHAVVPDAAPADSTDARPLVRGVAHDSAGRPVPGAHVAIADVAGRGAQTATDAAGRFTLALPGPGRHVLDVHAVGFRPASVALDVRAGRPASVVVVLRGRAALAPVQVIGRAGRRAEPEAPEVLTSVSVLSGEQVARENVQFAQEVLRKVPGVYHANFNQGTSAGDVGLRGFNTEVDIASAKLVVDGIPTNYNNGRGEFSPLFPLEIDRVEVVRGTNDPRYGLFNLAGNVGVVTRRGGSYTSARALGGSFGTGEAQALVAREHAVGRAGSGGTLSQTWFGGWRRSDGYREHSGLDRRAGSGKLFYATPGRRLTAGVVARVHALEADAPGYLTAGAVRVSPRLSPAFSSTDGGTVDTRQASAHLEVHQTHTLTWAARAYAQRFDRVRFVRFDSASAQQERVEDERQAGAVATATWRPAALAAGRVVSDAAVHAGADWQDQDNVQQRFRTAGRARQATLRDYAFTFANGGGFVRAQGTVARRLTLDAGLRLDRVGGGFRNVQTGAALPVLRYGWIPQPKAGASLALGARASVYGNYGRSFQVGSGLAAYGTRPLTWSKNDGVEGGVILQPLAALALRAAAWRQDASDELRLRLDDTGDSENVGRTRRAGVDVEGTARLARAVSLWGALTTQRAVLVEPGATNAAARGKRLNHVPDWTAKYGADWTPRPRVRASFWAYGQGGYYLTDLNDGPTYGGYTAVNADVSVRLGRGLGAGLALQNAFGRRYAYVWHDGRQALYSPANPRALLLTLTLDR